MLVQRRGRERWNDLAAHCRSRHPHLRPSISWYAGPALELLEQLIAASPTDPTDRRVPTCSDDADTYGCRPAYWWWRAALGVVACLPGAASATPRPPPTVPSDAAVVARPFAEVQATRSRSKPTRPTPAGQSTRHDDRADDLRHRVGRRRHVRALQQQPVDERHRHHPARRGACRRGQGRRHLPVRRRGHDRRRHVVPVGRRHVQRRGGRRGDRRRPRRTSPPVRGSSTSRRSTPTTSPPPTPINGDTATEWATDGDGDHGSITIDLGSSGASVASPS